MEFTDVIVSEIPASYATDSLGSEDFEKIDLDLARRQWAGYVDALKQTGVRVTTLPADERYPDCVFVEDPAVIIGDHALLTKPGDASRAGETIRMKPVLKSMGLVVMEITDPEARIDGGDVHFTGKEILCGISSRTNLAGCQALAAAFPGYRTIPIEASGPLHLKTLIGQVGEDTLCVSDDPNGYSMAMFKRIQKQSDIEYKAVIVPDDSATNTVYMNGRVVCKGDKENPNSWAVMKKEVKLPLIGVSTSEIEKAVGSLTCLSLRFNRPSRIAAA